MLELLLLLVHPVLLLLLEHEIREGVFSPQGFAGHSGNELGCLVREINCEGNGRLLNGLG